jgi:hypothetical protein
MNPIHNRNRSNNESYHSIVLISILICSSVFVVSDDLVEGRVVENMHTYTLNHASDRFKPNEMNRSVNVYPIFKQNYL